MDDGTVADGASAQSDLLTVSVVSHGHDAVLPALLNQLAESGAKCIAHVVVTHNRPPAGGLRSKASWPFKLTQITNREPAGFGANHNRAFKEADTRFFCVLNPDVVLSDTGIWASLVERASGERVGCAFPTLLNTDGTIQDNARAVPTPGALFRRRILRWPDTQVDWASAAFWVVPSQVYARLNGFDERYFMYCEDVDFCLRLRLLGMRLEQSPERAVHLAQRDSHQRLSHLSWHVRSLTRLWASAAYKTYRKLGETASSST